MYVSFQNIEKLSSSPLILYENISIMSTIHQCKFTLALYLKNIFEDHFLHFIQHLLRVFTQECH